jgi:hypothetical protein
MNGKGTVISISFAASPAHDRPVRPQPTAMNRAGGHLDEMFIRLHALTAHNTASVRASSSVLGHTSAPATNGAIRSQAARMEHARGKLVEAFRRGDGLAVVIG